MSRPLIETRPLRTAQINPWTARYGFEEGAPLGVPDTKQCRRQISEAARYEMHDLAVVLNSARRARHH
jgi:hypothetical protein